MASRTPFQFADSRAVPAGRQSTMLALRLGQQTDPAMELKLRKANDAEANHADLQQHRADKKRLDEGNQQLALGNLLERQLDGVTKRALAAANLTEKLIQMQREANGAHDLTHLFLHMAELDPADPDYNTQVAQLRIQYPQAAMLKKGNEVIEAALKAAAPQQAVYAKIRELGDLSAFTKRGPNGEFLGFHLKDAQDALQRRQMQQFNTLPAGSTGTLPLAGGASAHVARPKALDLSGIALTQPIADRITKQGENTAKDLRLMLDGKIQPFPAMAAEVARVRQLTPSEQQQWIDDGTHEAMQQAATGIKNTQTQKPKTDRIEISRGKALEASLNKRKSDINSAMNPMPQAKKDEAISAIDAQLDAIGEHYKNGGTDTNAHESGITLPETAAPDAPPTDKTSAIWGTDAAKATEARKLPLNVKSKAAPIMPKWTRPKSASDAPAQVETPSKKDDSSAFSQALGELKKHASRDVEAELSDRYKGMAIPKFPSHVRILNEEQDKYRNNALSEYTAAQSKFQEAATAAGIHPDVADAINQHLVDGNDVTLQDVDGATVPHVTVGGVTLPILPPAVASAADE